MTQDSSAVPTEMAETASVADGGEPQRLNGPDGPQAAQAPPTAQELDARDEAFAGPRKPMGPVDDVNVETVPDEVELDDEQ